MRLRLLTAALCLLFGCSSSMEDDEMLSVGPGSGSGDSGSADTGESESSGDESGDTQESEGDGANPPDMGDEGECDPWLQDCPEGLKCVHAFDDVDPTTKCVELSDEPKQLDEPCKVVGDSFTGIDNCDVGLSCQFVNEYGEGFCVALCDGSPDEPSCAEGSICRLCGTDCPSLCLRTCDPLEPETCGQAQLCTPNNNGNFVCTFEGKPEDQGAYGSPCEFVNDCSQGFACVEGDIFESCETGSCCAPYCNLDEDIPCPNDLECVPWLDDDLPPELDHVGVCIG